MVKRVKKSTQSVTGFEFFWLFRKQLDHRTLNYFDGKLKLNPQQIKLAAILTHHPYSGMQMAAEIRQLLNLTKAIEYPLIPDSKYDHVAQSARLIDFVTRTTSIKVRNLASQICKDMKYDSLTWQMPYLCWVLTSVLPIPPDGHAIEVSGTATYDPHLSVRHGVKALKSLNNPQFIAQGIEQGFRFVEEAASGMNLQEVSSKTSAALFSLGMKRITYPAILLRGYASKNAMIQWVTDNYDRAIAPLYEHDARKYVDKVTLTSVLLGCLLFWNHTILQKDWDFILNWFDDTLNSYEDVKVLTLTGQSMRKQFGDLLSDVKRLQQIVTETKQRFELFHPL